VSPAKPLRPCAVRGCPRAATDRGRCAEHARAKQIEIDKQRGTAIERGYGPKWRIIRKAFLRAHPQCNRCGDLSTVPHHKKRVEDGGTNQWSNLEALCKRCHDAETMNHDVAGR
jgi:5-methylcytosine-specific restriction protein A